MKYWQTGEYCNQVETAAWGEKKNLYLKKKGESSLFPLIYVPILS